jgi:hypothetical protein
MRAAMRSHFLQALLALHAALAVLCPAQATPPTETPIRAEALRTDETLVLDGTLAHPAWQRAPVHEGFVEKGPVTGAVPLQATRVRVLFDERALWVGVEALDTAPGLIRDDRVRHDMVNRTQDFVVVYLDGVGKRSAAQFFRLNAAGSTADGLHTAADDSEDFAPDFDWDGAVSRMTPSANGAGGWTAVFRIPFASLRYADGAQQAWRIMVARRLPRAQFHLFSSVLIPRDASSFIATMQPLQDLALPADSAFLTVRPGLTLRRTDNGREPARNEHEASLDVKWRPRAELVVDATLNPDFSQVELDVPQLAGNSRFALFLTEKRPFFFESYDLLRTPTEALYTRSVTAPKGGLRATWRGSAWAGTGFALKDRGGGLVLLPGTFGSDSAEQPGSTVLALRARHDDGRIALGGIVATRRYDGDRGDNSVLGPDIALPLGALPGGRWRLRAQALVSRTDALPAASGELGRGPAREGHLVRLRLQRQADNGESALTLDDVDEGFRHDSGFVTQVGVRRIDYFHSRGWQQVGPFNELYVNVEGSHIRRQADGQLVEDFVRPGLYASGARNFEGWLEWYGLSRLRLAPGQPLLQQRYWHLGLVMTPAPWMPLLELSSDIGRLADTAVPPAGAIKPGWRFFGLVRLRPLRWLELEPRLNTEVLERDGSRSYREAAAQLLAVWHLDARQNLRLIAQRRSLVRLAEPGVAAEDAASHTTSLTYAWRFSAGTRLYVGASGGRSARGAPGSHELFVKLEVDADDVKEAWRRRSRSSSTN